MNRTIEPKIGNRQRFCCLDVVSSARVLRDTCCIAANLESCPWNESFHQSTGMEMIDSVCGTPGCIRFIGVQNPDNVKSRKVEPRRQNLINRQ